jgi:hypothetical protein
VASGNGFVVERAGNEIGLPPKILRRMNLNALQSPVCEQNHSAALAVDSARRSLRRALATLGSDRRSLIRRLGATIM